jgi:hypothetical protein
MDFPLKEETYNIIGLCMEVHNNLVKLFIKTLWNSSSTMSLLITNLKKNTR